MKNKPHPEQTWKLADRQTAWNLWLDNRGLHSIAEAVYHSVEEVEREIRRITGNERPNGERRQVCSNCDRHGRWGPRDLWALRRLKEAQTPMARIVVLLGKPEDEIRLKINPRQGYNNFGLIKETT